MEEPFPHYNDLSVEDALFIAERTGALQAVLEYEQATENRKDYIKAYRNAREKESADAVVTVSA